MLQGSCPDANCGIFYVPA